MFKLSEGLKRCLFTTVGNTACCFLSKYTAKYTHTGCKLKDVLDKSQFYEKGFYGEQVLYL